ncbi:hypothetical protein C7B62_17930 [Pleurocapsa sp. CCALA 161]|uniref:endo-1,4-beta-xylanase n=1 Tax=Pleurocapsa sp. CCALA 161 TaxID=2107688 RepID=UPI000D084F14|nr:endo-1,4-beta-xylanase [Pleurocapsa sp. CCALA 161]PSB08082.1 hypothetical protein C7B62_17930 [Pleurocapsa sp. CCALA 161]
MIVNWFLMAIAAALLSVALLSQNTLKDLAAPDLKVGSVGIYQTFFPPGGKSQQNYRNLYQRELNAATVLCYPGKIWTGLKQYDFAQFNTTVNWFEEIGLTQIAHLLVGSNHYYPEWFIDNSYTEQQLEELMEDYIRAIMQSNDNRNKIDVWNVVNETIWYEGAGERYYTWNIWNQLGWEEDKSGLVGAAKKRDTHPVYIRKALEIARKYTNNKLELRDNGIEFPNEHEYYAFYQLVKHLLNQKVPLDAVGFQTHLNVDHTYDWEGLKNNIRRYKDLGLEVYITELNVANDGSKQGREKQRQYYYDVVKAAKEGGADLINLWGLNDGQMGEQTEDEFAHLFEGPSMKPKPAYYGFQAALKDAS